MNTFSNLARRTVLITGATRGLGRALARRFAALGHTVIACGTSAERCAALVQELGTPHHVRAVDVTSDGAVAAWAQEVLVDLGAPDLVLNNAGVFGRRAPIWEISAAELAHVLDVNVAGVVNVLRHFVPAMIARGTGVICNLSSGWGQSSAPLAGAYCASKFAVEGLTGSLAQELPAGLAAIALSPGVIHTEMLATAIGEEASSFWSPEQWVEVAVPFILGLGREHNGQSLRIPER